MILPIVAYGDPVLRKESKKIDVDYPNLKELITNMKETMYNASGVGLAAPQVAINKRVMVYNPNNAGNKKSKRWRWFHETIFVNPTIVEYSDEKDEKIERCLSFPNMGGEVIRSKWIVVEAFRICNCHNSRKRKKREDE